MLERAVMAGVLGIAVATCSLEPRGIDHGPVAPGISGRLGEPVPHATNAQLAAFERGREIANRRFSRADGLGPSFNATFCGACHEKPATGGGAGLYRNFFFGGTQVEGGAFIPLDSGGPSSGVVRQYAHADHLPLHPGVPDDANVVTQRNPIPLFGVGAIAELDEATILGGADPDDRNGDGISGRPNYDGVSVGRFGRKAQSGSIERIVRAQMFNHVGITTGSLIDDDGVADPELSTEELSDLVSFTMLLAAPVIDETLDARATAGRAHFDGLGCHRCHTPRLVGPRGPLPLYSDLLLHDMGEELADGFVQGHATGSEFRTQPLWGITAVGPYLHDGRAMTIEEAILMHGGEGLAAADAFSALSREERDALLAFLDSLGGREQKSEGLIPPDEEPPAADTIGGPLANSQPREVEDFLRGRAFFDRELGFSDGVGAPRLNGDSCRGCHFEPVIGGAGPRGVNVIRHGIINQAEQVAVPAVGTILHRGTALRDTAVRPQSGVNLYELRQTQPLFGLGLVESIPEDAILANADPDDTISPDGISGKPSWTDGGRLGRFGWKAQVPTLAEFSRDAATTELGLALPYQTDLTFGAIHDTDDVVDPEVSVGYLGGITAYMARLAPIAPKRPDNAALAAQGEALFGSVGCAACHVPSLPGESGDVPLYSDLLLHEILPEGAHGIEEASANAREFRTAPLWGIRVTAPYLHDGRADTLREAILGHDGEAADTRERFVALSQAEQHALLAFLETL